MGVGSSLMLLLFIGPLFPASQLCSHQSVRNPGVATSPCSCTIFCPLSSLELVPPPFLLLLYFPWLHPASIDFLHSIVE